MNDKIKLAQKMAYGSWEQHIKNQFMLYPNEALTRFIYKNDFKSVLDYGCGDGRHTQMIASKMTGSKAKSVIAIDINKACIDITQKRCEHLTNVKTFWLNDEKQDLKTLIGQSVDCVVCFGVLHLNTKEVASKMLNDFNSVLSNGGHFFSNWRTQDDSFYKSGKEIDKNTFIINSGKGLKLLYYFPSLDEIKAMYKDAGFEILSLDLEEFTSNNMQTKHSFYLIEARKM